MDPQTNLLTTISFQRHCNVHIVVPWGRKHYLHNYHRDKFDTQHETELERGRRLKNRHGLSWLRMEKCALLFLFYLFFFFFPLFLSFLPLLFLWGF